MSQLANRLGELDRTAPVYVVCASGNRSAAMTDLLVSAGYDAASVTGGTSGWIRSGRASPPAPSPADHSSGHHDLPSPKEKPMSTKSTQGARTSASSPSRPPPWATAATSSTTGRSRVRRRRPARL